MSIYRVLKKNDADTSPFSFIKMDYREIHLQAHSNTDPEIELFPLAILIIMALCLVCVVAVTAKADIREEPPKEDGEDPRTFFIQPARRHHVDTPSESI